MTEARIHVGTSGWNYSHWKGVFYPKGVRTGEEFPFYCQNFHTVEINNTFYNLPDSSKVRTWYEAAPEGFVFAVKASRYITHIKKLKDPRGPVDTFIGSLGELKEKLGPILFQLPPSWSCNLERLESFLDALPGGYRYTFEFRHEDWLRPEVYRLLEARDAAFCIYDLAGKTTPRHTTASWVYIRLHGPGNAYEGLYSDQALGGWAGAISAWKRAGKSVFCYFDNDQNGYAPRNARSLARMVES